MRMIMLVALALTASSCGAGGIQPTGMIPRWTNAWREIATDKDRLRLRDWRKTFVAALASAQKAGHSADIAREGALLDPDAALGGEQLSTGMYRCRVIKLGSKVADTIDYIAYPAFTCRVRLDHNMPRLEKMTGSQRYVGILFPHDAIRQVFLGSLVLGDEVRAMQYSEDPDRDVAGYIERIGPKRWRLVMPNPTFESQLDVMELVHSGQAVP